MNQYCRGLATPFFTLALLFFFGSFATPGFWELPSPLKVILGYLVTISVGLFRQSREGRVNSERSNLPYLVTDTICVRGRPLQLDGCVTGLLVLMIMVGGLFRFTLDLGILPLQPITRVFWCDYTLHLMRFCA